MFGSQKKGLNYEYQVQIQLHRLRGSINLCNEWAPDGPGRPRDTQQCDKQMAYSLYRVLL